MILEIMESWAVGIVTSVLLGAGSYLRRVTGEEVKNGKKHLKILMIITGIASPILMLINTRGMLASMSVAVITYGSLTWKKKSNKRKLIELISVWIIVTLMTYVSLKYSVLTDFITNVLSGKGKY